MTAVNLIVTYNPPQDISSRQLQNIGKASTIIVDNGSSEAVLESLEAWQKEYPSNRTLIKLGSNLGIATALNRGMQAAIDQGYEFVLLLDHDSVPESDVLHRLSAIAKKKVTENTKFAALGANLIDPRSSEEVGFYSMAGGVWRSRYCTDTTSLIKCDFLNSSGSFIYVPAWQEIGSFDDSLFIDHVDTDWFMRAKSMGYAVYGTCEATIQHYLGDSVVRYWFFGYRYMPHRTPGRHYTIVRNSLWLYRRSYVLTSWKINNFFKLLFTLFFFSIFDADRKSQFTQIIKAWYHGIFKPPEITK